MSFTRNKTTTVELPQGAFDGSSTPFPGRRGAKIYDPTGRSLGTFTRARDAWAALDAIDAPDA